MSDSDSRGCVYSLRHEAKPLAKFQSRNDCAKDKHRGSRAPDSSIARMPTHVGANRKFAIRITPGQFPFLLTQEEGGESLQTEIATAHECLEESSQVSRQRKEIQKLHSLPTIRDVARIAGVSIASVSRTLNHPHLVQQSTRQKIHSAIQQTAFQPNELARCLRSLRGPGI